MTINQVERKLRYPKRTQTNEHSNCRNYLSFVVSFQGVHWTDTEWPVKNSQDSYAIVFHLVIKYILKKIYKYNVYVPYSCIKLFWPISFMFHLIHHSQETFYILFLRLFHFLCIFFFQNTQTLVTLLFCKNKYI